MSQPLTLEMIQEMLRKELAALPFVTPDILHQEITASQNILRQEIAASEQRLTQKIEDATEPFFTALKVDLTNIEEKLTDIQSNLYDGTRLDELERRQRKMAAAIGRPDLTVPIRRPIGT